MLRSEPRNLKRGDGLVLAGAVVECESGEGVDGDAIEVREDRRSGRPSLVGDSADVDGFLDNAGASCEDVERRRPNLPSTLGMVDRRARSMIYQLKR